LPPELQHLAKLMAQALPPIMRAVGLAEIGASPVQVGISTVNTVTKRNLPGTLPPVCVALQPKIARLLSDLMVSVGVLSLTTTAEPHEYPQLQAYWDSMSSPPTDISGAAGAPGQIKLNVDQDPTGKSVLNGAAQ